MPAKEYEKIAAAEGMYAVALSYTQPWLSLAAAVFFIKLPNATPAFTCLSYASRADLLQTGAVTSIRFEFANLEAIEMLFDMSQSSSIQILSAIANHLSTPIHIADQHTHYVGSSEMLIDDRIRIEIRYGISQSKRWIDNVPDDLLDADQAKRDFRVNTDRMLNGQDAKCAID